MSRNTRPSFLKSTINRFRRVDPPARNASANWLRGAGATVAALTLVLAGGAGTLAAAAPTPSPAASVRATATPTAAPTPTPAGPTAARPTPTAPVASASSTPIRARAATPTPTSTPTTVPTGGLPDMMSPGPVYDRWLAAGGMTGELGKPVHPLYCGLPRGGCFQAFAGGNIYQGPTGVWIVPAANMATWGSRGWEAGTLGYPTSDRWCTLPGGGCFQRFERGNLYTVPGGAQYVVDGAVLATWGKEGWESGHLGYPTSDLACTLRNGGCLQRFVGGVIYRVPSGQAYYVKGAIFGAWGAERWESGHLGYPTSSEQCWIRGGCFQTFEGGSIYFSPSTGAKFIKGEIRNSWGRYGWETGRLGYPTSNEQCWIRGGCFQTFTGGSIYWSPDGGAHPVFGEIAKKWGSTGWEGGHLGYPITDELCGLARGGCVQEYRGGLIYWSMDTGAHFVKGAIRGEYAETGWENGLGYPTTDEFCGLREGGCGQHFQGGSVYFTPRTGANAIVGPFVKKWAANGWETGWMGYPTTPTYLDNDNGYEFVWQEFDHAYLEAPANNPDDIYLERR